jgi:hypothetical protein
MLFEGPEGEVLIGADFDEIQAYVTKIASYGYPTIGSFFVFAFFMSSNTAQILSD